MSSNAGPKPNRNVDQGLSLFLNRLGADLDPVIDQKCFQTRVDEGGQRGREGTHLFGLRSRAAEVRNLGPAV